MPLHRAGFLAAVTLLVILGLPAGAGAATFHVTTTTDLLADGHRCVDPSAECALRAAIQEATGRPGEHHDITVPTGRYHLTRSGRDEDAGATGDLDIHGDVTITGGGVPEELCPTPLAAIFAPRDLPLPGGCGGVPRGTVIDGLGFDRVLEIHPGARVLIQNLAVVNGDPGPQGGGGIANHGTLRLLEVAVVGNRAFSAGGGIFNGGTLTLDEVTVARNSASSSPGVGRGGGIYTTAFNANFGEVRTTIWHSLIMENETTGAGGGLYGEAWQSADEDIGTQIVFLGASTVAANRAMAGGGGVWVGAGSLGGPLLLTPPSVLVLFSDATIVANRTRGPGGGIFYGVVGEPFRQLTDFPPLAFALDHVFIVGNTAAEALPGAFRGDGGGIFAVTHFAASDSAIRGNAAADHGGGIYQQSGILWASRTEISQNSVDGEGGGIYGGRLALTNSTLSGNSARGRGGALRVPCCPAFNWLDRVTIADNRAGSGASGLDADGGEFVLSLTLLARGGGQPNCRLGEARLVDAPPFWIPGLVATMRTGFNVEDRHDCGFSDPGSLGDADLSRTRLGPLQNNGGPTWTHALLPGSPALDRASPTTVPVAVCLEEGLGALAFERVDQRGVARPQNTLCDAGAYERPTDLVDWLLDCCLDSWLWAAFGVRSAHTTSADFRLLMLQVDDKDGAQLADEVLMQAEGLGKALQAVAGSQTPDEGAATLGAIQQEFAAIDQPLKAIDACCVAPPGAEGLRLLLGLRVARARDAFAALAALAAKAALLDALDELMQKVRALELGKGLSESLLAPLEATRASLGRGQGEIAADQLAAFTRHVQALAGKQILDTKLADALIGDAQALAAKLLGS
jgi:hypothetical protein